MSDIDETTKEGSRELVDAKAYEVSLVDVPANKQGFLVIKSLNPGDTVYLPFQDDEKEQILLGLRKQLQAIQDAISIMLGAQYSDDEDAVQFEVAKSLREMAALPVEDLIEEEVAAEEADDAEKEDQDDEEAPEEELAVAEAPALEELIEAAANPEKTIKDMVSEVRELSYGSLNEKDSEVLSTLVTQIKEEYAKTFQSNLTDSYRRMMHADITDVISRLNSDHEDTKDQLESLVKSCKPVDEYVEQIQSAEARIKELEEQLKAMSQVLETNKQVQSLMKSAYNETNRYPAPSGPSLDLSQDQSSSCVSENWTFDD